MYGSIADWRAYALARGDSAPTDAEDADATAALVRASDYIRSRYVPYLRSSVDVTTTPSGFDYPLVAEAAYIAASFELATSGFFSKSYTPDQVKVLTAVEGIKWTPLSSNRTVNGSAPVSTKIEALMEPYITDPNAPGMALMAVGSFTNG